MIGVTNCVDGEVVDDTAGGHIRVSLWVNVGVTFPRFPGSELCKIIIQSNYNFLLYWMITAFYLFEIFRYYKITRITSMNLYF